MTIYEAERSGRLNYFKAEMKLFALLVDNKLTLTETPIWRVIKRKRLFARRAKIQSARVFLTYRSMHEKLQKSLDRELAWSRVYVKQSKLYEALLKSKGS